MIRTSEGLAPLLAAFALLGGCTSGSDSGAPDAGDASLTGTDPGPLTERERLEARYPLDADTARIADRLRPEALEAITGWDTGSTPTPYTGAVQLDPDTSWAWQLTGEVINTAWDANVYVLDLFAQVDGAVQRELHDRGRYAFCYFSVGTWEPWRPDRALFDDDMLGDPYIGFDDERWLDVSDPRTVRLMINRLDMARDIGCDGVELDNIDGYVNATGQPGFTESNARDFVRIMANEAHERGLAVALKNAPSLLPELIEYVDLSINESCHHFDECEPYGAMTAAGKPVFNAEYGVWSDVETQIPPGEPGYEAGLDAICATSAELDLRTLLLPKSLDGSTRYSCDDRAP